MKSLMTLLTIVCTGLMLAGCETSDVESHSDAIQDSAEETADDIKDAAEDLGEDVQDSAEDVADKAEDAVD
ncbi:YtxH domain-containing protein [Thalassoglobus sp. JC818]|uniref:YtxH domain-containing protein n=1 Tax=Thalassoglobus sp. JC818 TaxID=3232136 RepID=UPI003457F02E